MLKAARTFSILRENTNGSRRAEQDIEGLEGLAR